MNPPTQCIPCSLERAAWPEHPRVFGLQVRGGAWRDTHRVEDGDLLVCEHGRVPRDGDLVVVWLDNESVLRRHHVDRQGHVSLDGRPATDEPMVQGVVLRVVRRAEG